MSELSGTSSSVPSGIICEKILGQLIAAPDPIGELPEAMGHPSGPMTLTWCPDAAIAGLFSCFTAVAGTEISVEIGHPSIPEPIFLF